jgi:hypothetical protein
MFSGAVNGINQFNTSFAQLGEALLSTGVLIAALVIITQVGGTGIQRQVRGLGLMLGIGAFFLRGYLTITTGTLAMF